MLASLRMVAIVGTLLGGVSLASAQPEGEGGGTAGTGIGIGAEAMLTGPAGLAIVYDAGQFHIDGILSFVDHDGNNDSDLGLGGRFLYHLHESAAADFSIGGGLGLVHVFRDNNQDDFNDFILEGLVQIRAFVVPNVALSGSAGVAAVAGDNDLFAITGQLIGSVGITYYFF